MLPALLLGVALTSALAAPLLTILLCKTSKAAPAAENQAPIKAEVQLLLLYSCQPANTRRQN